MTLQLCLLITLAVTLHGFFVSNAFASEGEETVLVFWDFPNNPDDAIADGGLPINAAKEIVSVGTNLPQYTTSGASTQSARATGWQEGAETKYWQVEFETTGYENITISSKQRSSATGPRDFVVEYKLGEDGEWLAVDGGSMVLADNWTSAVLHTLPLSEYANNYSSVYVRWLLTSNTAVDESKTIGSAGASRIDDIVVQGTALHVEDEEESTPEEVAEEEAGEDTGTEENGNEEETHSGDIAEEEEEVQEGGAPQEEGVEEDAPVEEGQEEQTEEPGGEHEEEQYDDEEELGEKDQEEVEESDPIEDEQQIPVGEGVAEGEGLEDGQSVEVEETEEQEEVEVIKRDPLPHKNILQRGGGGGTTKKQKLSPPRVVVTSVVQNTTPPPLTLLKKVTLPEKFTLQSLVEYFLEVGIIPHEKRLRALQILSAQR